MRYTGEIPPEPLPTLLKDATANGSGSERDKFCDITTNALERSSLSLSRPNPWNMPNVLCQAIEYANHLMDLAMEGNRNRVRCAETRRGLRFPRVYIDHYQTRAAPLQRGGAGCAREDTGAVDGASGGARVGRVRD